MGLAHGVPQYYSAIHRQTTVGMNLDENPFRATGYMNCLAHPQFHSIPCRRRCGADLRIFEAWQHAPLASLPVQCQRSLDDHQRTARWIPKSSTWPRAIVRPPVRVLFRAYPFSAVCTPRSTGSIPRIVEGIDHPRLGRRGRGWEGEIRIAPRTGEDSQFGINTAPIPIGPGIAERPVTVNKAIAHRTGCIRSQETLFRPEPIPELRQFRLQPFRGVMSMMQVDFHFRQPLRRQFRQQAETAGIGLFSRIEEGVARRPSIRIAEPAAEFPVVRHPLLHRRASPIDRCAATKRFKVVGHAEDQVSRAGASFARLEDMSQVTGQPEMCSSCHPLTVLFAARYLRVGRHKSAGTRKTKRPAW